jgi:LAO/AO transport system kinase
VLQVSALKADGIAAVWDAIALQRQAREGSGAWTAKRREQSLAWMWERIQAGLRQAFLNQPGISQRLADTSAAVRDGRMPPSTAARQLLAVFGARNPA